MALPFSDDFESYPNGATGATELGAVWLVAPVDTGVEVQAGNGHLGTKGAWNKQNAIQKTVNSDPSRAFDLTVWGYRTHDADPFYEHGVSPQITSAGASSLAVFGFHNPHENSADDTTPPTNDLRIFSNAYVWDDLLPSEIIRIPDVYLWDTWQKFRMVGCLSTVQTDHQLLNADGSLALYVDDVLIYSSTTLKLMGTELWWDDLGVDNTWTDIYFSWHGLIDEILVTNDHVCAGDDDEDELTPPTPTTPSIPCCQCFCPKPIPPTGSPSAQPLKPQLGPHLTPVDPVYWTPQCTGGGEVPTASDPTDVESWIS